ncbi:MAG: glycoside hydrolase [Verrucomicrobia bacterium]|nr:MAG: glycoside hydrolase [Verrucomicrobiota bacterium]PYL33020.1 MAG: glycoside hydrolase [Verrucomicrobiota bacterium]
MQQAANKIAQIVFAEESGRLMRSLRNAIVIGFAIGLGIGQACAGEFDSILRWRNIGPYRGGRTRAIAGVPSQPNVFYMAPVNGGVFKSIDYGRTWQPIFDDQPTASIGAIAVAPSNPNIVYAGSGEGLHRPDLSVGDGIYKSTDAGRTWTHLGLRDGQQIAQLVVDPKTPDRIFVAVTGHPFGPNEERGVYRSLDGGKTFEKVLYRNENVGASDVQIDPNNPQIVYAALWESREGPWENGVFNGDGGGIFKSIDGGKTWRQLSKGLPGNIVQANLTIAPSAPKTLFAAVRTKTIAKLYRSDDAGETWSGTTDDPRPGLGIGGGDLPVVRFDPKNSQIVYSASVVCWKSTDGGKTWEGWRGAPGGDDYQNVWINPSNPDIILLGSDQGAIVTVNGGKSWSSWYNQPTAQLYHVSADNTFPYRLYSGQQESGSVGIKSRGDEGEITFRDWKPVATEEYGYVVADPRDPDIIIGGKLTRFDRRTGQAQNILPVPVQTEDFRMLRTEPVVFSPLDPHLLFFAGNALWQTRDRGDHWEKISPDLSRPNYELPASIGKYKEDATKQAHRRGVIYTVAPSPLDANRIWCGTDDGLIHLTTDAGKTWSNVTPGGISAWQKISLIEAGHFDSNTAYAAVNTIRIDDLRPHIFATHDGGKTWTEIANGIPAGQIVNAVREDPEQKGVLFAGTERGVYVSFDDGANWESLRLNLPASSVRDLIVKNDDLIVATHGRGFWILDNITPLRQINTKQREDLLFKPQSALRVRANLNTDTPLPPDEPAGENPPDGAMIDYFLSKDARVQVTIEIKDGKGQSVRKYSSTDRPIEVNPKRLKIPSYWIRPLQSVSTKAGLHRFLWDMHYTPVRDVEPEFPICATYRNTAPAATSPWAAPGDYMITLTVDGKTFSQPLAVAMDPRVKASGADLQEQFDLSWKLYQLRLKLAPVGKKFDGIAEQLTKLRAKAAERSDVTQKLEAFAQTFVKFGPPHPRPGAPPSLFILESTTRLFNEIERADAAPTAAVKAAVADLETKVGPMMDAWHKLLESDLPALNQQLKQAGFPEIKTEG